MNITDTNMRSESLQGEFSSFLLLYFLLIIYDNEMINLNTECFKIMVIGFYTYYTNTTCIYF